MTKKYIFVLFLLILAFSALSMASAADIDNDSSLQADDNAELSAIDESKELQIDDNDELKSADEESVLSAADDNILNSKNEETTLTSDENAEQTSIHVNLKATSISAYVGKFKYWKVKIYDDEGNLVKGARITLTLYKNGVKKLSETYETESEGTIYFNTEYLSAGTYTMKAAPATKSHYYANEKYCYGSAVTSKITIKKIPLKIKVKRSAGEVDIFTKTKSSKAINGIKLIVKIYTGKKYKKVIVTTGSNKKITKYKGMAAVMTNDLKVGNHKVVITIKSNKYKGSAKSVLKVTKKIKKYTKILALYSKGKFYYYTGF